MANVKHPRAMAAIAAVVVLGAIGLLWGRWDMVGTLLFGVVALAPPFLAVRQMIWPREEPEVTWRRALIGPAVVGAAVGWAGGEIVTGLRVADCGDETWGCLGYYLLLGYVGIPATAVIVCLALWAARTPRPLLTGLYGLMQALALTAAYTMYLNGEPAVIAYVLCFLSGYLVAALAIGQLLPPVARLGVYLVMLLAGPVASAAYKIEESKLM